MVKSDALKYAIAEAETEHGKEEITVNFAFASDGTEPLVEKGQVMARQQFVINEYQFDKVDTPIAATSTKISGKKGKLQSTSNIEVEETNSYVKVSAKRMSVTIGKKTVTVLLAVALALPMSAQQRLGLLGSRAALGDLNEIARRDLAHPLKPCRVRRLPRGFEAKEEEE